ncbi:DUF4255 domain-containing protein [Thioalkalivibrio nitratireducens]|uniref:DUF4255 domain-containing protein n=1 Tax=Thioalkalivibrio nitratireducens TaxID=186931 RepID=UPI0005C15F6B|nr:DUF4255 domain-containing protein [Thioalkalivibrio nitratireducens]
MASYRGVKASLLALAEFLSRRLPSELRDDPVNGRVSLLGSADVATALTGNLLGIYLHRLVVDPHGRSRHFPQTGTGAGAPQAELPLNLHVLLIANGTSPEHEADLLTWAMLELATDCQLDVAHMVEIDDGWSERELLTVMPEEMSTEDLMRIWDVFEAKYTSTAPYVLRTVRLRLRPPRSEGPPVTTRVLPAGVM